MIRVIKIILPFIISGVFLCQSCPAFQDLIVINGIIKDTTGIPVGNAAVIISELNAGTYTDLNGFFSLSVPADEKHHILKVSVTGYESKTIAIVCNRSVNLGEIYIKRKITGLEEITVTAESKQAGAGMIKISPKDFSMIPSASGSFETVLKTLPGVSSNNELSSQYSVRGGNFDENLVYINDIEIFRPFLIRSGQQEGLSVINPDLTGSVLFSPGGFGVTYGDKLSSVLDITYRHPTELRASVSAGLLYNSVHFEGINPSGKISWLTGIRYKSSRMMLKTLDSKGDYLPVFADFQSLVTMNTGKNSELSIFGTYSSNTYNYIPRSRESKFGNEAEAYRLYVLFEGREKDLYRTWNTALTWKYSGKKSVHKIIASYFGTNEKETFDIRGYYSLNMLDKNTGSENMVDTSMNIGAGSFLSHARNRINANFFAIKYSGSLDVSNNLSFRWGIKASNEMIKDNIREWKMVDSAGFSIPHNTGNELYIYSLIKGNNNITNRICEAYGETRATLKKETYKTLITGGIRSIYSSFTSEFYACPRFSARVEMNGGISVWLASGAYFQPPFYREMRFPDGTLNNNIKSQKSWHVVTGISYDFKAWERPFRFTAEIYNKKLSGIIPYRLDNVRIIYEGDNLTSGYSRGIDMRLYGEFVEGAESWFSLSFMDSKLKMPGIIEGMFPSPSEQTVNCNIFFQDYLPGNPGYRAHINISFITGLPVISPFNNRYDQYHRMPSYRRVDLGITRVIKGNSSTGTPGILKEMIVSVEIYNLLDINNTVSYFWIKTVNNQSGQSRQFAVPDYLTGRSLNFKVKALF